MKHTLLLLILAFNVFADTPAAYYRVWQGFSKPGLSSSEFKTELNHLMEDTVTLYQGKVLNQYLVAIPPKHKPSYVPDEFALVALHNEADYRALRETPEGIAYSDLHWVVFDRQTSRSAPFHNFYQDDIKVLEHNHAYDMFGKPVDWTKGHSVFFLGLRNKKLGQKEFMKRLYKHVKLTKNNLTKHGLQGYIFISNENYEIAYLNWKSKDHLNKAFQTADGKEAMEDANQILTGLQYGGANPFTGPVQVTEDSILKAIY